MNLGFGEMLFIFLLALIIFGPKRLPEIGRQIGKALAEFKRYSNDFKYQLESEVRQWEIEDALNKEKESLKASITPERLNSIPPEGPPEGTIPTEIVGSSNELSSHEARPVIAEPVGEGPVPKNEKSVDPPENVSKETNA
jgi:sec-independent protein translocase protein TatB